eukprot:COSAG01_NODE_4778_length_4749_cov_231.390108_8_plen_119_part_00
MLGTDSAVLDSSIHDCGCAGIRAHGGNGTTLDPGNLQILRNSITNVAQWKRTYSPGIHWGGVNNTCRLPRHTHVDQKSEMTEIYVSGLESTCFHFGAATPTTPSTTYRTTASWVAETK